MQLPVEIVLQQAFETSLIFAFDNSIFFHRQRTPFFRQRTPLSKARCARSFRGGAGHKKLAMGSRVKTRLSVERSTENARIATALHELRQRHCLISSASVVDGHLGFQRAALPATYMSASRMTIISRYLCFVGAGQSHDAILRSSISRRQSRSQYVASAARCETGNGMLAVQTRPIRQPDRQAKGDAKQNYASYRGASGW